MTPRIKIFVEKNNQNRIMLDLSTRNINSIPNFEELILNKNNYTELSSNHFDYHTQKASGTELLGEFVKPNSQFLSINQIKNISELDIINKITILTLVNNKLKQIPDIEILKHLKELYIDQNQIEQITRINELKQLEVLDLNRNKIKEITGIENLINLKEIDLEGNEITYISGLDTLVNLKKIYLSENKIQEISALEKIISLNEIHLNSNQIQDLPELGKLINLHTLNLGNNQIEIIKGLNNLYNLTNLILQNNKIRNITGIDKLLNLEQLNLNYNNIGIEGFKKILQYVEGKKLPQLKKLSVIETGLNWYNAETGNIAQKLRKQGVEIIAEDLKFNTPKIINLFEKFLEIFDPKGELTDQDRTELYLKIQPKLELTKSNIEQIEFYDKGFTSKKAFEFNQYAIKIDKVERLRKELKFYQLNMGDFSIFMPNTKEIKLVETEAEAGAILIMPNLKTYENGVDKANKIKTPLQPILFNEKEEYNLYLMGLFHKEASKHKDNFEQILYRGVHGRPHWEEGNLPYVNCTGEGLEKFLNTRINSEQVRPIIENYLVLQNAYGETLLHGDWKEDNLVNGHLIDYAMVGRGFEIDELAYYLTDPQFKITPQKFHNYVEQYIADRINHDNEFREKIDSGYRNKMYKFEKDALLTQLVLRHSVMNKRNMNDPEKYKQRQYYQNAINQILKENRYL